MTTQALAPDQRVVVYSSERVLHGVVLKGLHTPALEVLFGGTHQVYTVLFDDGLTRDAHPSIVLAEEDFAHSWHVVLDGKIIAGGGSISEQRANEIAVEVPGSHVVQGGI